jgi:choice-of-anchor B domain-containing protein
MMCDEAGGRRVAAVVSWSLVVSLLAGGVSPARADDDDGKVRDKKPAVLRSAYRNPDPWKVLSLAGPVNGGGDSTFPSRNISLLTWLPLNTFPGYGSGQASGADCWGYTSPSGREYALMGLGWGIGIVEVTNPLAPQMITTIPGPSTLWHDVTVIGHYAYAVTDSSGVGIQVIDLANIDQGQAPLVRNYSQGGHTTTHSMVENVASGHLYLCGGNAANGGMIPASTLVDPTFPNFVGNGWRTQYVHEAQVVTYTSGPYAGREIAFLFAGGPFYGLSTGLAIADVTDKNNIQTLCNVAYPGLRFCHQGWISPDHRYLYIDDELDDPSSGGVPAFLTRVFDITDLSNPRLVSTISNGLPSIDHNQYVNGRYLFQSNYTSGLRVWDLWEPLRPVEVAFIDTRPESDAPTYNGDWGNYPYFASGTVLISDMERGLFLVKPSLLEFTPATVLPRTLTPGAPTPISIQLAQKNAQLAQANLLVRINAGAQQTIPLSLQDGSLVGAIPAVACGGRVEYSFVATTTDNRDFVWPLRAPAEKLTAFAQSSEAVLFADDFEIDRGWTSEPAPATSGAWARVTPLHNGGHGAVVGDGDGSGKCFVTGAGAGEDVDAGPVRLLSPPLDLSSTPEARISYRRWVLSIVGQTDNLIVEVSPDNGAFWYQVETVGPASGGWTEHTFRVADFCATTSQVRVRFRIEDLDDSTTEAGVDGFRVVAPACPPCYANCDESTSAPVLNVGDFTCFLQRFAAGESYANCDNSTVEPVLNVGDFTCFLQRFAAGCP